MSNHYKISSPNIVAEKFGGELVILNLGSGQYFGLNSAGTACWEAISAGASISKSADSPEMAEKVARFAIQLEELGLISPTEGEGEILSGALEFEGTPEIEVFNDLADLIVADPIHDMDAEFGWPIRQEEDR